MRLLLLTALLLMPAPAAAVQPHGGIEGLVSHQLGHILFLSGALFLLAGSCLRRWRGSGWAEFRIFLLLISLWNCLTFFSHWLDSLILPEKFILSARGLKLALQVESWLEGAYYLSRLDHLVLLPALIFLLLALRSWTRTGQEPPP